MTRGPRYCSPGWLTAYVVGLLLWLAIYELWGACVVVVMLAGGAIGIVAAGNLLATGHVVPPEERR